MCVHFKCISYDALIHKPQGSEANKSPEMCCFANWALLQTAHFIKFKKTAFCIHSESPSLYQGSFSQEEKWHCFSDVHLIIVHGWWRPNNDVMLQCMCLVFKSYNHLKSSFIGWCNGPVTWDTFEQPLTSFFFHPHVGCWPFYIACLTFIRWYPSAEEFSILIDQKSIDFL